MKIDFAKYPFPSRVRHHTHSNLYFPKSELNEKMHRYPPIPEKIDWQQLFANGRPPNVLDIGCGKGAFLLDISELAPTENFLGIDIRDQLVDWINAYARGENLYNCAAVWYSVVNGLDFLEDESVSRIYYLFPDPWPKTRHIRRRAFSESFLKNCYRKLKKGGMLYLATDVEEVDSYHKNLLEKFQKFDFHSADKESWAHPETNKELFCMKHKISVHRIICRK